MSTLMKNIEYLKTLPTVTKIAIGVGVFIFVVSLIAGLSGQKSATTPAAVTPPPAPALAIAPVTTTMPAPAATQIAELVLSAVMPEITPAINFTPGFVESIAYASSPVFSATQTDPVFEFTTKIPSSLGLQNGKHQSTTFTSFVNVHAQKRYTLILYTLEQTTYPVEYTADLTLDNSPTPIAESKNSGAWPPAGQLSATASPLLAQGWHKVTVKIDQTQSGVPVTGSVAWAPSDAPNMQQMPTDVYSIPATLATIPASGPDRPAQPVPTPTTATTSANSATP